jgi:sodium/hydrogen antiporter
LLPPHAGSNDWILPRAQEPLLELETAFGLIAGVLVVSALAAGLVERAPLSFPMLFLGLGFLLGDRGLQVISIGLDSSVLEVVAVVALALVLFLDAVNLELTELRRDWLVPVLVLGPATLLVIGLLAGLGTLLLDLPVVLALLLGTILASTDPVVLRDVLRDLRIPRSVRRTLSVEAGTNDIVVLPILLVLIAIAHADLGGVGDWLVFVAQLFLLGPAAGFAVGAAGSWVMGRVDQRFQIRREYQSLYGIGLVLGSFVAGEAVGGDGFLAAFAAGLAVTVVNQTLCACFLDFGQVIAEMTMLLAFVLFGALLSTMVTEVALLPTLLLALLAIFVIRPLAVLLVLRLGRAGLSRYARQFIAWFGPRGLNSLLFALLVVAEGVPGGEELFAVVGVVVLVSVVAHASPPPRSPAGTRARSASRPWPRNAPARPPNCSSRARATSHASLHSSWPSAWPDRNRPSSCMSAAVRSTTATASVSPAASGSCPTRLPSGRPTASATSPLSCTAPDRGSRPAPVRRCSFASSASSPRRSKAA